MKSHSSAEQSLGAAISWIGKTFLSYLSFFLFLCVFLINVYMFICEGFLECTWKVTHSLQPKAARFSVAVRFLFPFSTHLLVGLSRTQSSARGRCASPAYAWRATLFFVLDVTTLLNSGALLQNGPALIKTRTFHNVNSFRNQKKKARSLKKRILIGEGGEKKSRNKINLLITWPDGGFGNCCSPYALLTDLREKIAERPKGVFFSNHKRVQFSINTSSQFVNYLSPAFLQ